MTSGISNVCPLIQESLEQKVGQLEEEIAELKAKPSDRDLSNKDTEEKMHALMRVTVLEEAVHTLEQQLKSEQTDADATLESLGQQMKESEQLRVKMEAELSQLVSSKAALEQDVELLSAGRRALEATYSVQMMRRALDCWQKDERRRLLFRWHLEARAEALATIQAASTAYLCENCVDSFSSVPPVDAAPSPRNSTRPSSRSITRISPRSKPKPAAAPAALESSAQSSKPVVGFAESQGAHLIVSC